MKLGYGRINLGTLVALPIAAAFLVAAFLRTYSPEREFIYSPHGGVLLAAIVGVYLCAWVALTAGAIRKEFVSLLGLLSVLWLLLSASTVAKMAALPVSSITGLLTSLATQIATAVFVITWLSVGRKNAPSQPASWLAWFLIVFSLASGFAAIQLLVTGQTLFGPFVIAQELRWLQLYGWYASPNYLVDSISLGWLGSLYLYFREPRPNVALLALTVLHALLLMMTGSRAGIMGGALAAFWQYRVLLHGRMTRRKRARDRLKALKAGALVLLVMGIGLVVLIGSVGADMTRYAQSIWRFNKVAAEDARVEIWSEAFDRFASNSILDMLLGLGNNMYVATYMRSLHNSYLQLLVDHGLLSLLGVLFFVCWFFIIVRSSLLSPGSWRICETVAFVSSIVVYGAARSFFHGPLLLSGSLSWSVTVAAAGIMLRVTIFQRSLSQLSPKGVLP